MTLIILSELPPICPLFPSFTVSACKLFCVLGKPSPKIDCKLIEIHAISLFFFHCAGYNTVLHMKRIVSLYCKIIIIQLYNYVVFSCYIWSIWPCELHWLFRMLMYKPFALQSVWAGNCDLYIFIFKDLWREVFHPLVLSQMTVIRNQEFFKVSLG